MQSITIPLQGFLNAIVYGWTREDFVQAVAVHPSNEITTALGVKSPKKSFLKPKQHQREHQHHRTAGIYTVRSVVHHPPDENTTHRSEEQRMILARGDPRDMRTLSETSDCDYD